MKSKFGIIASFVLMLLCMLFAVSCPSRSGASNAKVTGIEFLNERDEVITSLELEKGIETVFKVKPIPRSAVNAVINLALVADENNGESEAAFNLNATAKKITGNVYSAHARLRATLDGASDVPPAELVLSVKQATPVEIEGDEVIENGSDSIQISLPAEIPEGVVIQSSTVEPQGVGYFDSENPTIFNLGQNIENGTLITVTSTLSDGSIVVQNFVKGEVVEATNIAIDTTQGDFVALPGEPVIIPVAFSPSNCTYHDSKYITFESSDEDVVIVQDGKVCLSSDSQFGDSATITGTSRDGEQFTFEVINNFYTPTTDFDLKTGNINVIQLLSDKGEKISGASLVSCTPENAVSLDAEKGTLTISNDSNNVPSGTLITCKIEYQDGTTESFYIVKGEIIPLDEIIVENLEIAIGESDTITPEFVPPNATYRGFKLEIQDNSSGIINVDTSELDNYIVAIVDAESLIGQTAELTLFSDKYPEFTYPITITAIASDPKLLSGEFSVSGTKKVRFAKGNLYWDGSEFNTEANQYDYRTWQYKISVIDGELTTTGTPENNVGLFYWSKNLPITYAKTYTDNDYNGSRSRIDTFALANGGAIQDFDVLSKDEWEYLISTRDSADQKCGLATISLYSSSVNGLVLLPDDWRESSSLSFISGFSGEYSINTYTTSDWLVMEKKGAVFLPNPLFYRDGDTTVSYSTSYYHSSTPSGDNTNNACALKFSSSEVNVLTSYNRSLGMPVRLVKSI